MRAVTDGVERGRRATPLAEWWVVDEFAGGGGWHAKRAGRYP